MATRTWVGTTSGTWTTTTNWLEGSIPVNGDDIVFGAAATRAPDPIDQSSVSPASLSILSSYRFNFGTAGSAIQLGTITLANLSSGGSLIHLHATVTKAFVKLQQGQTLLCKGTWALILGNGRGLIDADVATVTGARISGLRVKFAAGTAPTKLVGYNAAFESSRNLTLVNLFGGSLLVTGTATVAEALVDGYYNHRSSGTVTLVEASPRAVIDGRGGSGFTLTTLNRAPGAKIMRDALGAPITVTTDNPLPDNGSFAGDFQQPLNTGMFL
jgi:hypothetical protein